MLTEFKKLSEFLIRIFSKGLIILEGRNLNRLKLKYLDKPHKLFTDAPLKSYQIIFLSFLFCS